MSEPQILVSSGSPILTMPSKTVATGYRRVSLDDIDAVFAMLDDQRRAAGEHEETPAETLAWMCAAVDLLDLTEQAFLVANELAPPSDWLRDLKAAMHDGDALAELIQRGTEALVGHVRVKPEDLAGPASEEPTLSDRVRGLEVSLVGLMTLLGRRTHGVDPLNIAEVSCSAWLAQQVESNPAALSFLEHGWGWTDDAGQVHRYVATVQRVEGQTPGEMITALKAKVLDQDQRIARLQAVLDAEQGKRGRPGWTWRSLRSEGPAAGQWERDAPANVITTSRFGGFESMVAWGGPRPGWMAVGPGGQHEGGADVADGLDAMEQADSFVGDP